MSIDPESTLEQRIARLEELALAQTQGVMLSHHLNQMEQQQQALAVQSPTDQITAAQSELSEKMRFTERQWERAKTLSQQLTQELFQSVQRRKDAGAKPNLVDMQTRRDSTLATEHAPRQARRNNTHNPLLRIDGSDES
jgi:formate dehydrogenase maturation protein FdhE